MSDLSDVGGHIFVLARRGIRHQDDPSGRVAYFEPVGARPLSPDSYEAWNLSPGWNGDVASDSRGVAGGVLPDETLWYFWGEREMDGSWAVFCDQAHPMLGRLDVSGTRQRVDSTMGGAFSPYGPLVRLPSGVLLQTFYTIDQNGTATVRVYRTVTTKNYDWNVASSTIVDSARSYRPTEAAMVSLGGSSDATTKLLLVVRTEWVEDGHLLGALRQYTSSDGGHTWRAQGVIPVSRSRSQVMPWVSLLSDGRVLLVWADRGTLSIKKSAAPAGAVFGSPTAWPEPTEVYHSALLTKPADQRNLSDFGYPSLAVHGSDPVLSFYDSTLSVSSDRSVPSGTTIFVMRLNSTDAPVPMVPAR